MPEGYARFGSMQAPRPGSGAKVRRQGQATVSEPSGVSGKSPSDAHEGRDPRMMTFVPTGTRTDHPTLLYSGALDEPRKGVDTLLERG